ncbi:hypothetical protein DPMN_076476 [Dreissena polymorpha]|uniref:Uncharacterized protein n=1 Tax=Dreissena polymorpha TaxID=45954 RepID=A0A9D3YJ52_DREPO|nr:hypothetical protein DPMN_076476 [Dreissena polymorpha]
MIRVNHSQISVICAWCYSERPREFRHIQDLSRHVKGQHPSIYSDLPSKSHSTMNCFFYARNPSAYLAIYPNISPYDSEEARAARNAVIRWASDRISGASQWNDGWSLLSDSLSIRPTKRPRHNPNYTIKSITITSANIIIYVTTDVDIFKIRIKESGITNPDVTTPLLHKIMSTDAHFTPPSEPWTRLPHHSQHQEPIINSLNIPDTYIHSIMTQQDLLFAPTEVTLAPSPLLRTTSETIKESAYKQLKTTVSATSSTTTVLTATSTPLKDQTTPTQPPTTLQRTPVSSPCPSSSTSLRSPTPISLDDKTHTSSTNDSGNCTA